MFVTSVLAYDGFPELISLAARDKHGSG